MTHTVRQGLLRTSGTVVLLLALTYSAAAAQRPSGSSARPASSGVGQAASAPTEAPENGTAEQTREQLERILEKYPPAVGRVLKLDPSLMNNAAYMAPYPLLSAYIAQHQDIAHNPGYFLENVNSPNQDPSTTRNGGSARSSTVCWPASRGSSPFW